MTGENGPGTAAHYSHWPLSFTTLPSLEIKWHLGPALLQTLSSKTWNASAFDPVQLQKTSSEEPDRNS